MKLLSNIVGLVTVSCVGAIYAQDSQEYEKTSSPLWISDGNRVDERYVERSVRNETAIQLLQRSSYWGHNIILSGAAIGIQANRSAAVNLDADSGTWNKIAAFEKGIFLSSMEMVPGFGDSRISNTKIEMCDGSSSDSVEVYGIHASGSRTGTELSNVVVDMKQVKSVENKAIWAIHAESGARVFNNSGDTGVSISFDHTRGVQVALAAYHSRIDLHRADISMKQGISIVAAGDGAVSLTNSKIAAESGNILIMGGDLGIPGGSNLVTLDRVDLSNALDQQISCTVGQITVNLLNGTKFDGYTVPDFFDPIDNEWQGKGSIILNIDSGASWNVTRYSDLGDSSKLSLSGDSTIYFHADGAGDFMNINSASVMLAKGSLLQLDMDSTAFSGGDIITLFTGADSFTNDGAILASADGYSLLYNDLGNGQFELTGQMIKLIPEPATATLGLLGLLSLASRRRRD